MGFLFVMVRRFPLFRQSVILALASAFCLALLAARVYATGFITYAFLAWNLFLAVVPYILALLLFRYRRPQRLDSGGLILILVWLAFLPNSFYLVTDLIHLQARNGVPLWYDVLLLFSFAWTGLMIGFCSLQPVHALVAERLGARKGWAFVVLVLTLVALGVYLGRFLRWNSWDLILNLDRVLGDVLDRLTAPGGRLRPYGMTLLLSAFFFLGYLTLYHFTRGPAHPKATELERPS
ncbi:MAG: DUF1361 domain-containing protein [Spirochaetales bacterium]|nr:DUF1361 domain-containing protein [Leptospiraceae bacterium]MCP5481432.1 DUF1361 domain-containing protein [Spirochaetales bacterium]MCP5486024.1 DUF1361 domain-containing protein [Spirochaetales bacterium]